MEEETLVQDLRVRASTSQPGRDGRLTGAEDPRGRRRVEPFGQRREHHGDLLRGRFQPVQRGVASGSEGGAARLATKRLYALGMPMLAVPDQSMEVSVSVPEVPALRVRTGEAFGLYPSGELPAGFLPRTRAAQAMALLPTRKWSRDDRRGSPEGFVA